jgi:hypothetical protein
MEYNLFMEREPNEESVEQIALATMLLSLMAEHPQPWRIDHDWSPEIYDANNKRFLTPSTTAAAEFIVKLAAEFDVGLAAIDAESQATADDPFDLPSLDSIPRFS